MQIRTIPFSLSKLNVGANCLTTVEPHLCIHAMSMTFPVFFFGFVANVCHDMSCRVIVMIREAVVAEEKLMWREDVTRNGGVNIRH